MSRFDDLNVVGLVNLVIPGGGLVLRGAVVAGVMIGVVFALCANLALWATLLIPDDFSPWKSGLAIGLAGGTYVGAQIRLRYTVRRQEREAGAGQRRAALEAVRQHLERKDYAAAWEAIRPVLGCVESDLLVARRCAQILSGLNKIEAAWEAWGRVRRLDRHQIYREETRSNEQMLERLRAVQARLRSGDPGAA